MPRAGTILPSSLPRAHEAAGTALPAAPRTSRPCLPLSPGLPAPRDASDPSCLKFAASGTRARLKDLPAESVLLGSDSGWGAREPPSGSPRVPLPGARLRGEGENPKQGQNTPLLVPYTEFYHPSSLSKCFLQLCPPQIKPAPPRPCCSVLCSPAAEQNPTPETEPRSLPITHTSPRRCRDGHDPKPQLVPTAGGPESPASIPWTPPPPGGRDPRGRIFKARAGGRLKRGAVLTLPQSVEQIFATNNEFRGRRTQKKNKSEESLTAIVGWGRGGGGGGVSFPPCEQEQEQGAVIFHQ